MGVGYKLAAFPRMLERDRRRGAPGVPRSVAPRCDGPGYREIEAGERVPDVDTLGADMRGIRLATGRLA
jgi:hypothetical protein